MAGGKMVVEARNLPWIFSSWPRDRDPKGMPPDYPKTKSRLAVTVLAAFFTWQAHNCGKTCGPVLASSAMTLVASLWSPGLGQAAFAGSFAGMSSLGVMSSWKDILLAGSVTAGLFEIFIHRQNKCLGLGGRLGFIAFVATNLVTLLVNNGSFSALFPTGAAGAVGLPFVGGTTMSTFLAAIQSGPLITAAICSALGAVATIVLRESAEGASDDMSDPVRASAVVGLIAALLIGIHGSYSDFGALMAFGGSFTGMSLPSRLVKGVYPGGKKRSVPRPSTTIFCFAAAGALGGLIHAATIGLKWWSVPAGWGGKAGACAFGGVLVFRGIEKIVYAIRQAFWGKEKPNYGELY